MVRYNKVIELLEQGKPVFCSGLVWNGNLDDLAFVADSDYDMTIIEMEHQDFSFDKLRMSLQFLLSRKKIAEGGSLQADPVPMVRVPPNFRERNQWVLKQALDTGVYGLVLPHLNTVEDAQAAVTADNTSEKSDATQAPSKPPATAARKQSETPQIPAKPQEEQTERRPSGLFGGLSFGGVSRSAIPDLTETTLQELGLDDADDQGNGAAAKAPNTGKSRSRKRENKKGGGKR